MTEHMFASSADGWEGTTRATGPRTERAGNGHIEHQEQMAPPHSTMSASRLGHEGEVVTQADVMGVAASRSQAQQQLAVSVAVTPRPTG